LAWVQSVAFLFGALLLVYLVRAVGVQPIFDALRQIGFGFFLILALNGFRHALRTLSMSTAVPPTRRRFSFLQAFAARLGGESISFLTFTGPLLGEATKVALLRKRIPLVQGVPALVVDNLLYNLSVVFFVFSGACVMLISYSLPPVVRGTLLVIALCTLPGIAVAVLATRRRLTPLTQVIGGLARRGRCPQWLHSRRHHVYRIELTVYGFYKRRRAAFFAMLGFDVLAHASSVLEVYVALRLLGFTPLVTGAFVIESLTKVINFAFGFVPGTIGVYEGGTEIILKSLGFAAATGIALAIVRKAAIVFWTSIGVSIIAWRALPNACRRLLDRSPRLRNIMDNLVLSNIAHRPARTAVSIAGIAIGVLLVVFTVGLAHGMLRDRGQRESNMGAEIMLRPLGAIGLGGSQQFIIPVSQAAEISRIEGVRMAVPIGQSLDKSDSGFGSRLVDGVPYDQYAQLSGIKMREGRKFEGGNEAIVDPVWMKEHPGAKVGQTVQIFEQDFRIVGVYEPPGGGRIKIPLATLQDHVGSEGRCSTILVGCVDPSKQDEVAARINKAFPDYQMIATSELPEIYMSGIPALNIFLNVVIGVASFISMLVILLAMYTTVTERTRQIGVLKSLGMSKANIAWIIEQEAILVSFLGVFTGVILTALVRFAVMHSTTLIVEIEPKWVAISLVVGLIGGSIGALYPALRAARQDAVDALNYE
jgi:putative ABC transport system permease protein